ncbi:hypothetical protein TNCV_1721071 [Trichonephila clavipes]|nr:hypothetical protein TNCV_1721071 [Trichonephila clavipes]
MERNLRRISKKVELDPTLVNLIVKRRQPTDPCHRHNNVDVGGYGSSRPPNVTINFRSPMSDFRSDKVQPTMMRSS